MAAISTLMMRDDFLAAADFYIMLTEAPVAFGADSRAA